MNQKIATIIRVELAKKNKNLSWLAEQMDTSKSNISSIIKRLNEGRGIQTRTLSRIEEALEISFFQDNKKN